MLPRAVVRQLDIADDVQTAAFHQASIVVVSNVFLTHRCRFLNGGTIIVAPCLVSMTTIMAFELLLCHCCGATGMATCQPIMAKRLCTVSLAAKFMTCVLFFRHLVQIVINWFELLLVVHLGQFLPVKLATECKRCQSTDRWDDRKFACGSLFDILICGICTYMFYSMTWFSTF